MTWGENYIKEIINRFLSIIENLAKTELSEGGRINLIFFLIMVVVIILFFGYSGEIYRFLSVILLSILLIFSIITIKNTNELRYKYDTYRKIKRKIT